MKFARKQKIALVIVGGILLILIAYNIVAAATNADYWAYLRGQLMNFGEFFLFAGVAAALGLLVFGILRLLDRPAVRTWRQLWADAISVRIRTKNAAIIFPRLQFFLYGVLSRNKEMLHLPLGEDAACLAPGGISFSHRADCVFYHFALVAPQKPDMEEETLQRVLQSYISSELNNYGIAGLYSCFQSRAGGRWCSVYVDRISYDEVRHFLSFDILYICTEEAARYAANAVARDSQKIQPEIEVYDDELQ